MHIADDHALLRAGAAGYLLKTAMVDEVFGATGSASERSLTGGQQFRATVTTGAKDADGNRLAKGVVWKFTTRRS